MLFFLNIFLTQVEGVGVGCECETLVKGNIGRNNDNTGKNVDSRSSS